VRARRALAIAALVLLAGGCAPHSDELAAIRMPMCGTDGARTTFLMAQAVPAAALVPCIDADALPADLYMDRMRIDSAGARFAFTGNWPDDEPGLHVDVHFAATCTGADDVPVRSDEPGTRRADRIEHTADGYTGEWRYTFDGGCTTYWFDAHGTEAEAFVHQVAATWTFMARDDVARQHDIVQRGCGEPAGWLAVGLTGRCER
jgi:hypothetical protein